MVRGLIIVLALALFGVASALECYSGAGSARIKHTCGTNENVCKKYNVLTTGVPAVYSCSSDVVSAMVCTNSTGSTGGLTATITTCYCNTDKCNGAETNSITFAAVAAIASAVALKGLFI